MTHINNYINYLKGEQKSEHTINSYVKDVEQMLDSISKSDVEITYSDLVNWRGKISYMASASVARKISAVKGYFSFMEEVGYITKNPAQNLKTVKIVNKKSDYLPIDEAVKLRDCGKNARDKAIVELYINSGIRVSELVNLTMEDYKHEEMIIRTKGGKYRTIYLSETCRKYIDEYLKSRNGAINNLFVSNQGTPMRSDVLSKTLKVLCNRAGINKSVSNHSLRHTHVSTIAEMYGIEFASKEIGHSNISTTMRYSHEVEGTIKARMMNFNV